MKIRDFWVIISHAFIHGILDNLYSAVLRLPEGNKNSDLENTSEWWLINRILRKKGYTKKDKILLVKGEEFIS